METVRKEDYEAVLRAFNILAKMGVDEKKALKTIVSEVKESYVSLVMNELK